MHANLGASPVSRIVIDSAAQLVLAARVWQRFPAYMRSLAGLIRAPGSSLLVTGETTGHGLTAQSLEGLMFLFDNVVHMQCIAVSRQARHPNAGAAFLSRLNS